jgi:hypothetical protein
MQQAEHMRHQLERTHAQEAEMQAKRTEIAEIQKMLSDARLAVHDERQQYMKIRREHNIMSSESLRF